MKDKSNLLIPLIIIVVFGIGYTILNYTSLFAINKVTETDLGGNTDPSQNLVSETPTQESTNPLLTEPQIINQDEVIQPQELPLNPNPQINTVQQEDIIIDEITGILGPPLEKRRLLSPEEEAESTDGTLALWYDNFEAYTVFETDILTSKNLPAGLNDPKNYFDKPILDLKINPTLPNSVSKVNGKYSYTPGYKTYKDRVTVFANEVNVSFHNTMKSKIKDYMEKSMPRDQSFPEVQALVDKLDLLYKDVAISSQDLLHDSYTLPSDFCDNKQAEECTKDTELFFKYIKELKKAIFPKTPDEFEKEMLNIITENDAYVKKIGSELGIDASDIFLVNLFKAK